LLKRLDRDKIQALLLARVIVGGMIPKVKACVRALGGAAMAQIVDGREPHALLNAVKGEEIGTIITLAD
jgi:acetylglutamate kinase